MQFESQWPGDAIAAPAYPLDSREDAFFEVFGGGSGNRVEGRSFGADAHPAAVVPKGRPREGSTGDRRSGSPGTIQSWSEPSTWKGSGAAAVSLLTACLIKGFALSAAAMHPEFLRLPSDYPSQDDTARDHLSGQRAETARTDLAGRRPWITSITSFFAELWSGMLRRREIRRLRAAWESLDDRTLKDIGISRHEIEYARHGQHRS